MINVPRYGVDELGQFSGISRAKRLFNKARLQLQRFDEIDVDEVCLVREVELEEIVQFLTKRRVRIANSFPVQVTKRTTVILRRPQLS